MRLGTTFMSRRVDPLGATVRCTTLAIALALAACASPRGALPPCEGPWTPINATPAAAPQAAASEAPAR